MLKKYYIRNSNFYESVTQNFQCKSSNNTYGYYIRRPNYERAVFVSILDFAAPFEMPLACLIRHTYRKCIEYQYLLFSCTRETFHNQGVKECQSQLVPD